jgi:hypothetical protein
MNLCYIFTLTFTLTIRIFLLNIKQVQSFTPTIYEPIIGKWKLLYSDNILPNESNGWELNILPEIEKYENNIDSSKAKLLVKIKKNESNKFISLTKIINSNVYTNLCEELNDEDKCLISTNNGENCCLVILKAEKYIKSIGIFELPYFANAYKSGMRPKYTISWKVDKLLNRLYIYADKNIYVFEKDYVSDIKLNDRITTNSFLATSIISFLFGKFLDSIIVSQDSSSITIFHK